MRRQSPCPDRCHIRLRNKFMCDVASACTRAVHEDERKGRGRIGMHTARQRRRPRQTGCRRLAAVDRPSLSGARPRAARALLAPPRSPALPQRRAEHQQVISARSFVCTKELKLRGTTAYLCFFNVGSCLSAIAVSRKVVYFLCERRPPAMPASRPATMKRRPDSLCTFITFII